MTLREVSKMAYNLSIGHYINGKKFNSIHELHEALRKWLATSDSYIAEIYLPDGKWLCEFYRVHNIDNCYDIYIPDTRQEENKLYIKLGILR